MQPHTVPTNSALVMAQQMTLCCLAAIYRTEKNKREKSHLFSFFAPSLCLSVCLLVSVSLSLLLSQEASLKVMEDVERETQKQKEKRKPGIERYKMGQRVTECNKYKNRYKCILCSLSRCFSILFWDVNEPAKPKSISVFFFYLNSLNIDLAFIKVCLCICLSFRPCDISPNCCVLHFTFKLCII